jgi:hypothetical protein
MLLAKFKNPKRLTIKGAERTAPYLRVGELSEE